MDRFGPASRTWFCETFAAPTAAQERGWPLIAAGRHTLVCAPTGSGKTLAAFLWCLDGLSRLPEGLSPGVRVLYVSPLKALVYDVERNLRRPLAGIRLAAERLGLALRVPTVAVRTGDTPTRARREQQKSPPDVLVTTPESLYLLLGSAAREGLRSVETVIVDEIHALGGGKRGAHLALSLERLAHLCTRDPQRIGLSATARPTAEVARFLGGDRPVEVVDVTTTPDVELEVMVPVRDMFRPWADDEPGGSAPAPAAAGRAPGEGETPGMWPAIIRQLAQIVQGHRSTIIFVNARGQCERICRKLNELCGAPVARAHHGSIAREEREQIEGELASGALRAIVATSSLELGIDMAAVDQVVLVESPGSVARGLQRVGRAGHQVGVRSQGRLLPKHPGDLLECVVIAARMRQGAIEAVRIPSCPLDVLAQQIVAMCAVEPWPLDELGRLVRRAANYRSLSAPALTAVLDMLAGRYPSTELADLRPRIVWDRRRDLLSGRPGASAVALANGGTIPDRGLYAVVRGSDRSRVGELDEEMVYETRPGDVVTLGATSWRVEQITGDRVIVEPAPGASGRLPFWHGDRPGRPLDLGRAIGAFARELDAMAPADAERWLGREHGLAPSVARNVIEHLQRQRAATGTLPTDRAITIERFADEVGDWRVCILSPFGGRVHAAGALCIAGAIGARSGFEAQLSHRDDGLALRFVASDEPPPRELLVPRPELAGELVMGELASSALFASHFRENAARALLLPRRRPGARTPLWAQRLRAQRLLGVARAYPSFPIVVETYRSCLEDALDLPGLTELLREIHAGAVRVDEVQTRAPSPFARTLAFAEVADHMYQTDMPTAERRSHALAIDRQLLRELLGPAEAAALIDPALLGEAEAELQRLGGGRRARNAEELCDVLRELGDLAEHELAERSAAPPAPWLAELEAAGRVVALPVAGEQRWISADDLTLYRRALGPDAPAIAASPPPTSEDDARAAVLGRWARRHGPFDTATVAARFGLPPAAVEPVLLHLEARGQLERGVGASEAARPWCEPGVMRRLRRTAMLQLRAAIAPVPASALGRFLTQRHGIGAGERGEAALDQALAQLEGFPLSFVELERLVLPARVQDFRPAQLDARGAAGQLAWVAEGALRSGDGRITLYRRARLALLREPATLAELGPIERALVEQLATHGASFFAEILAANPAPTEAALASALWTLVWAGLVTNDSFEPLRARASRPRPEARRGARSLHREGGGRWLLCVRPTGTAASPTEQAHARTLMLLDRYGVVSREMAAAEELRGGFGPIYEVLREMEQAGQVRRGSFVAGLGAAQFALPGVVDRLRGEPEARRRRAPLLLGASDPANPFGALVPWPAPFADAGPELRRAPGASVVLVDGMPALYVDSSGRGARSFRDADDDALGAAARALGLLAARRRGRYLRLLELDGEPARRATRAATLRAAGFEADHRALVLEAPASLPTLRDGTMPT